MKTIVFPKLAQHQQEVFDAVKNAYCSGKIFTVKSRRQVGKSTLASIILIYYATQYPGCISHVIEPTNSNNRRIYRDLKRWIEKADIVERFNDGLNEIFFKNGSEIHFLSQESRDGLRGNTTTGILILDEAAFLETCMEIVLPYVDVHKAPILMISTPMFLDSQFAKFFLHPDNATSFSFDWADPKYDMSKFITKEKLDYYKRVMSPLKFNTEMMGLFAEGGGYVFSNLKNALYDPEDKVITCAGIDFANGTTDGDSTVFVGFNKSKQMVKIEFLKNMDPHDQILRLAELINENPDLKIVQYEQNSMGAVYGSELKQYTKHKNILKPFTTSNESKKEIVEDIVTSLAKEDIKLLDNEELLKQMAHFVVVKRKNGNYSYENDRTDIHDDAVMATAIAYNCFKKKASYKGRVTVLGRR